MPNIISADDTPVNSASWFSFQRWLRFRCLRRHCAIDADDFQRQPILPPLLSAAARIAAFEATPMPISQLMIRHFFISLPADFRRRQAITTPTEGRWLAAFTLSTDIFRCHAAISSSAGCRHDTPLS
jgi:hypothetical protein